MREGGNGKSVTEEEDEIRPSILQSVGTIESFYTSDMSNLWFGKTTVVASVMARFGRLQSLGRETN